MSTFRGELLLLKLIKKIKPLIAMRVDPFDITFPESIIENKE